MAAGARCRIIDNANCSMFHSVMASPGPHVYAVRAGRPPPRSFLRCGTCPARLLVRDWLTLLISVRVIVADRCTPFALNRVASFLDASQALVRRSCCGYVPRCAWLRGPSQRQSCCCGNIAAGLHSSSGYAVRTCPARLLLRVARIIRLNISLGPPGLGPL